MDNNFLTTNLYHRNAVKMLKTHSSGMASGFNAKYLRSFSGEVTAVSWKITNKLCHHHYQSVPSSAIVLFSPVSVGKNRSVVVTFFFHLREGWT